MTIDTKALHLYVTRNAVLGYQGIYGGGFESIRRRITVKLLDVARQDPENDECFLLDAGALTLEDTRDVLRVYTIKDGPLLVVTKTELVQPES